MTSPSLNEASRPATTIISSISSPSIKLGNVYQESLSDGIILNVCPGKEISWNDFLEVAPKYSIALDGLVGGAPRYDANKICANFNHHQDVDRLATRSTSGQVQVAIKQGLMDSFQESGFPKINIYVNDPDQDSCLAVWLLANHERISGIKSEPLINKLVFVEDLIDTTAGGYPFSHKSSMIQEQAWIFEPYVTARMAGRIQVMDGSEMANVIAAVGSRIDRYTLGQSEKIALDTSYEIIGGGKEWKIIKEHGFYARTALFNEGIKAFVSVLREDNGIFHYSIGKMSPFVRFPIQDLYIALNHEEGLDSKGGISWNGGDTIGGSPRRLGSKLTPKEVENVINGFLARGLV